MTKTEKKNLFNTSSHTKVAVKSSQALKFYLALLFILPFISIWTHFLVIYLCMIICF